MSLGQIQYPVDSPYLNSEQINLLMSLNDNYKDRFEQQLNYENQREQDVIDARSDAYDKLLPSDGTTMKQMDVGHNGSGKLQRKMMKHGGFFGAILGPLLGALAGPMVNGLFGLFKKKKKKPVVPIPQPVAPTQQPAPTPVPASSGSGVSYEGLGALVSNHFLQNAAKYVGLENSFKSMTTKRIWQAIRGVLSNVFDDVIGKVAPENADELKREFMKRMMPNLFTRLISKASKKGESKVGNGAMPSRMVEPMLKYAFAKLTGSVEKGKEVFKQVKPHLRGGEGIYGGKFRWDKVRNIFKSGLKFGLPIIAQMIGQQITPENIKWIINSMKEKFGAMGSGMLMPPNYQRGGMTSPPNGGMTSAPNKKKASGSTFRLKVV